MQLLFKDRTLCTVPWLYQRAEDFEIPGFIDQDRTKNMYSRISKIQAPDKPGTYTVLQECIHMQGREKLILKSAGIESSLGPEVQYSNHSSTLAPKVLSG